jgi:phosphotriesterase-related protein
MKANRREFLVGIAGAGLAATSARTGWADTLAVSSPTAATKRAPGTVETVRGRIDASNLGFTLPHEHVCAGSAGFWQAWPEFFGGKTNFINKAVEKLKEAKAGGVDTIVDVTPIDVGRDVRMLEEVSRKSGMQIVACTGHWLDPSVSMKARSAEELTDFFTLEIERGIEGTDIKPGVIKVATDHEGVTPFLDKALRAAARASKATGVPVTTHTYAADRIGEKQAAIFEEEGLSPASVCLGHCDDSNDMDYLRGLVKRGYTIGMDHMPWGIQLEGAKTQPLSWQQRSENIKRLIDEGFGDRIFLSNDWYFGISIGPAGFMEAAEKRNPDGLLFNNHKTIPYLKTLGVTHAQIRRITVENPRQFFGGS